MLDIFEGTSENESSCHVEKTITGQIDTLLQRAMKKFAFAKFHRHISQRRIECFYDKAA